MVPRRVACHNGVRYLMKGNIAMLQYQSSKKAGFRALLPTTNATLEDQRKAVKKLLRVSGGVVRITHSNNTWAEYRLTDDAGTAVAATGQAPHTVTINGVRYVPAN